MIEALLRDFRAEDTVEAAIVARLSQFVASHGEAVLGREIVGGTGEISGHLTAAAWILDPESARVLLVCGAKEDVWKVPGAHCEAPTPAALQASAAREANRALGQIAHPMSEAVFALSEQEIPAYWNTPVHLHFEMIFRFAAPSNEDLKLLPRGARWFDLNEALQLNREPIARCIRKTRSEIKEFL